MCFYNGSGSRDRTYDIFVNSEAQLPAVLFRNKLGAVDGNRTRLNHIDSVVPSQRATTAKATHLDSMSQR
jgi:hypothetical protein